MSGPPDSISHLGGAGGGEIGANVRTKCAVEVEMRMMAQKSAIKSFKRSITEK